MVEFLSQHYRGLGITLLQGQSSQDAEDQGGVVYACS